MKRSPLSTLRNCVFKYRLQVGLAVSGAALFVVRPQNLFGDYWRLGTLGSLGLVIAGLALRAWAGGSAGAHTRTSEIEAPRLATGGPYAYVRNPIYLASIVLGIGMVGLLGDPWMLILCLAVFLVLYTAIVPAEERFLREHFGAEYLTYSAAVPRMFPRLRPWSKAVRQKFCWPAAAGEARIAMILAAIYLAMRAAVWLRGAGGSGSAL